MYYLLKLTILRYATLFVISIMKSVTFQENNKKRKQKKGKKGSDAGGGGGGGVSGGDVSASGTGDDWTWKDQVDMVKWTDRMIGHSLLGLEPSDLNKMALECFARFGH